MKCKSYQRPKTLGEALAALKAVEGPALVYAGGTDILVYARQDERYAGCDVVDVYGLPELSGIREEGDRLVIGAGVTHAEVEASELVRRYAPILGQACATVGSPQIRNHGTLAGNIANASPAADTLASLAVLDARIEVNCGGETRCLRLDEVVTGPYKNSLSDRDLITAITVKKMPQGSRGGYLKLGRRKALAISRLTIAGTLHRDAAGVVDDFCMTVGAVFPRPMVFPDVNALLVGKKPGAADIEAVAKALSDKIPEVTGIRHSTKYKQPVTKNLVARVLGQMLEEEKNG